MGAIHVHEFISLDGVFENPSWTFDYGFDPQMGETIGELTPAVERDPAGPDDVRDVRAGLVAPRRSRTTRVPRSSTTPTSTSSGRQAPNVEWGPSTLIPYDPDAIRKLKDETDGIYISGSGRLVRGLLKDGLVDDLHLFVYPIALGTGERFWADGVDATKLQLKGHDTYSNGVVHLDYGPA